MARYDADDVRDELTRADVVARYGWKLHPAGRWLRSQECPSCGGGSSDAFAIGERGFRCHRCQAHGDLIALVALAEGLDCRRDFERVLELAAEIAGVPPRDREVTADERQRRRQERERMLREAEAQRQIEERQRYDEAAEKASAVWDGLRRRNRPGETYLRERGLGELVSRDDVVRFDEHGTVRVPLYDERGRIVNVPGRYLPGRERAGRKILAVTGCPTRGSFGHPDDLLHLDGDAVLTEGIFDYLSALVLWPERACFGAHGAGNLPHVARRLAAGLMLCEGVGRPRSLRLVPHQDAAGLGAARKAARAAMYAGLPRDRVRALDVSAAGNDLNDWLRATPARSPQA